MPLHHVIYRRGAAGQLEPILRGTGIRVQTIIVAHQAWGMVPAEIASEYDLTPEQVTDALAFYEGHRGEIEASLAEEQASEAVGDAVGGVGGVPDETMGNQ